MPLITLTPQWEAAFLESLVGPAEDRQLAMAPSRLNEFIGKLRTALDAAAAHGEAPVILVNGALRVPMRSIVERLRPSSSVLSQAEISARVRIRTLESI